jgi:hypothetical protein
MRVFSFSRKKKGTPPAPTEGANALSLALEKKAGAASGHSYLSYLLATFRSTSPYVLWQRARTAFAPAIFLSRVLRVLRWVFRILEASALFLFAAALLLFALPFALAALLLFVLAATLDSRRADRELASHIAGKRVLVLFANADASVRAFAPLVTDYTVLLITPLFTRKGEGALSLSFFRAARRREDGVILVRDYYYFHLARRLLSRAAFCARIY